MVDWVRVRALRDEIGGDDFAEVACLFLEEVEEVLRRLTVSVAPERLEADMHFLKGSAWNVGFVSLGALCARGEKLAAEGRCSEIDIAEIATTYAAARDRFLEGLSTELGIAPARTAG